MDRALRGALKRAGALAVLASVASCSFVLDWGDYTTSAGGDSGDAGLPDGAPEAMAEASTCNPSTCGGCCGANGVCSPGVAPDVCGVSGAACVDCTAAGQRCVSGACAAESTVDSGPECTDKACAAMGYKCPNFVAYPGVPCCQAGGTCGCTYAPGGNLADVTCGPKA